MTLAEQEPLALAGSPVRAMTPARVGRSGRSLVGRRPEFPPPGQGAGVPLAHLRREATSLQVVAAPSGMSVVATSVAIWDPSTIDALRGGEVVLAVGVAADGSMVTQLFEAAVRANAAAVVLKDSLEIQWAKAQAIRTGIALITIPRDLSWESSYAEIRAVIGAANSGGLTKFCGTDLFQVAEALSREVGSVVVIQDAQMRVVAHALPDDWEPDSGLLEWIGRRSFPQSARGWFGQPGQWERVKESHGAIRVETSDDRYWWVMPVRAGAEVLGFLWLVSQAQHAVGDLSATCGEYCAVASVMLLRRRSASDHGWGFYDQLLAGVLQGTDSAEVLRGDRRLQEEMRLVAVTGAAVLGPIKRVHAESLLTARLLRLEPDALVAVVGSTLYALVATRPDAEVEQLCRELINHANHHVGRQPHCVYGRPLHSVVDLPAARAEVDRVLSAISHGNSDLHIASTSSSGALTVLYELGGLLRERPHLLSGRIQVLIDSDAVRNTDYVATLFAYFDAACDLPRAARALFVHRNTLRYRLRKIVELSGLDLEDPVERLIAELQLRLLAAS